MTHLKYKLRKIIRIIPITKGQYLAEYKNQLVPHQSTIPGFLIINESGVCWVPKDIFNNLFKGV